MKLSERITKTTEHAATPDDFQGQYWPTMMTPALIAEIEELERKAALWDKVSALPCVTDITNSDNGFDFVWNIFHKAKQYHGDTLEEALNQIPEGE